MGREEGLGHEADLVMDCAVSEAHLRTWRIPTYHLCSMLQPKLGAGLLRNLLHSPLCLAFNIWIRLAETEQNATVHVGNWQLPSFMCLEACG
jgi:hypothetical protein